MSESLPETARAEDRLVLQLTQDLRQLFNLPDLDPKLQEAVIKTVDVFYEYYEEKEDIDMTAAVWEVRSLEWIAREQAEKFRKLYAYHFDLDDRRYILGWADSKRQKYIALGEIAAARQLDFIDPLIENPHLAVSLND